MWVFPLAAAIVALAFAASLARRFARSRRLHLAMWSAALVMYAIASLAVAIGALAGWSRSLFEIYWILGAVLNVPLLAAGEVHLLRRGQVLDIAVWVVLAFVVRLHGGGDARSGREHGRPRGATPLGQGGLR